MIGRLDNFRDNEYFKAVAGRLAQEIKQTKPFALFEEEVFLNVLRTAELLTQKEHAFLKQYGLSGTQYNVLRILRGAVPAGLTCTELSERMIARDPDITRLLDRMQARDLVWRERSEQDRRVVLTHITEDGLALLDQVQDPLEQYLLSTAGRMPPSQQEELVKHLEELRHLFGS